MINQRKTWKVFSYLFQLSSSTCGSALSATFNCFVRLSKLETFTKSKKAHPRIRSHHSSLTLMTERIPTTTFLKTLAGQYSIRFISQNCIFCRESLAETISVKSGGGAGGAEEKMGQDKEDFEPAAAPLPSSGTEANE